jgi:hypothetical protein
MFRADRHEAILSQSSRERKRKIAYQTGIWSLFDVDTSDAYDRPRMHPNLTHCMRVAVSTCCASDQRIVTTLT